MWDLFMSKQKLLLVPLSQGKTWNYSSEEARKYAKPGDFDEFCEANVTPLSYPD